MSDFCLVRQPIFGSAGALIGYEIRYGATDEGKHGLVQSVLSGTFDLVRGGLPAFVACGREQLIEDVLHMMDPRSSILLLPRDLDDAPEVVAAIARYREAGGQIALDDIGAAEAPSERLLPYASWARIDVHGHDPVVVGSVCDRLTRHQASLMLMAHHVDDLSQYEVALQMGVDAFQGAFFSSPEPVPAADMPQSTVAAMRLMGLVRDPNVTDRTLEDVLSTDPVLMFQLLRLVNSAAVGMRGVSSIGQALRLIGRNTFQRWLSVAVAASKKSSSGIDQELVRHAVERGRMLEQLSGGGRDSGALFLVGMFSMLDSVFRMTLPDILDRVELSDEANAALLDRTGPYADALAFAESYEMGMFESAAALARDMGIDPAQMGALYANALSWTNEALGTMQETAAPVTSGRAR